MIEFIKGLIAEKHQDYVVIAANGLGYRVYVPSRIIEKLITNQESKLFTHHHIREDSQELFGFLESSDREVFHLLIGVSGVGPKVALKALGQFDANTLLNAISREDVTTLTQISGIGKKGAERIIIELKDKCGALDMGISSSPDTGATVARPVDQDVYEALRSLGYDNQEVRRALQNSANSRKHCETVEDNIKVLLKHL